MNTNLLMVSATCAVVAFSIRPARAQAPFSDVPANHWAYAAVDELKAAGIVEGYLDRNYGGSRPITRYEFAIAIARILDRRGPELNDSTANATQGDIEAVRREMSDRFASREEGTALRRWIDEFGAELEQQKQNRKTLHDEVNSIDPARTGIEAGRKRTGGIGTINGRNQEGQNTPLLTTTLIAEKPTILLGEPIRVSFVVHNPSATDLQIRVGGDYRNSLGRPESFTVTVLDDMGKPVPQPDADPSLGGIVRPEKIPARGTYTFALFLPHWATFAKAGTYSIVVRRTLQVSKYTPGAGDTEAKTSDMAVEARTTITVTPPDLEKMGNLIAALGKTLLTGAGDAAAEATRRLTCINDERVIPYFVRAFDERKGELRFAGVQSGALDRYNNQAAFETLQKAMDIHGSDINDVSSKQFAQERAANIRQTATMALLRSPYPEAFPFLLTRRNDPAPAVRLTILHALGKQGEHELQAVLPLLREMSHDKNTMIRDEAKRYLTLLSPKL